VSDYIINCLVSLYLYISVSLRFFARERLHLSRNSSLRLLRLASHLSAKRDSVLRVAEGEEGEEKSSPSVLSLASHLSAKRDSVQRRAERLGATLLFSSLLFSRGESLGEEIQRTKAKRDSAHKRYSGAPLVQAVAGRF
jgi:hypothetical protein